MIVFLDHDLSALALGYVFNGEIKASLFGDGSATCCKCKSKQELESNYSKDNLTIQAPIFLLIKAIAVVHTFDIL